MSSSIARYEAFLIKNVSTIATLESSLRSITWFLPGRFRDADLASEALSALLNLTSMYHDTLLEKSVRNDPKYKPLIPMSLHTRYTRAWVEKSPLYKWASRTLEIIRFTQLLMEMCLRRKVSQKTRWRSVIALETIKAVLRLVLLRITRRPLLSPPIPERDLDPASIPPPSNASSPTLAPSSPPLSPPTTPEHLKNNHTALPLHPLFSNALNGRQSDLSAEDYLLPKALTTSSVKPALQLVKVLSSPLDWLSEIIYIARPLVYASLLAADRSSSRPLVTAFIMDVISRNIRRRPPPSATLERAEHGRRDKDLFWYLLRGPVWESYTRPKLEAVLGKMENTPLLGLVSALVKDWIPLVNEYYYCT
ncbi:hypothetical protein M378DRAFT_183437 [Amanita muscaria Koide BX008]|uniref:Peroxisomal membrane protein PEX16 n=1 Tax=Amanita muscaria (strain Koide BX008) TaxID=946122 RepID=A0A0C2XNW4_AMAMK|nr:hypothetical protein M378DRAFT_183437 [Amanita muscaria Koide BX008]